MASDAEIVRKAVDLLREEGWVQGAIVNDRGYCLIGALGKSGCLKQSRIDKALNSVLAEQYPDAPHVGSNHISRTRWNDAPGRTKDEVIAVLEKTALRLEEGA